jgi:hypothetical protein
MATPIIIGLISGAIAGKIVERLLIRRGIFAGRDLKAKMDRKEAIAILGLRCICVIFLI